MQLPGFWMTLETIPIRDEHGFPFAQKHTDELVLGLRERCVVRYDCFFKPRPRGKQEFRF